MSRIIKVVVLAAGLGARLSDVTGGLPKPLVRVGGRSILERSLEVIRGAGLTDLTVVVGFEGDRVREAVAAIWHDASIVENEDPETTGSMRSLALAWASFGVELDCVLVVEGDVVYGPEALDALLGAGDLDRVLLSGPTGAGDEVWARGRRDRITEIAKRPSHMTDVLGELVGLSLLSAGTLAEMAAAHAAEGAAAAMEHYEERISSLCERLRIKPLVVEDLVWGEVDDGTQLQRVEQVILPRLDEP